MTDERASFGPNTAEQSSLEQSEPSTLKESWDDVTQTLTSNESIECTNQLSAKSVDLISLKNSIYVNGTLVCYTYCTFLCFWCETKAPLG